MDIQHKRRVAERAAKELNAVFHIGASDADLLGNLGNVSRDVEADYLSRQATDTIPKVSKLGQSRPGHHSDKASPYGHGHSHGRNAKRAMSRRLPVLPVLPVQGQKLWEAPVSQYETFARSPTRRTFEEEQSLRNRTSHPHRSLDVMLVGQGISNWTTQGPKELEEPWHETYEDATLHENAGIESFPEGRDTPSPMQLAPLVVHDTAYQTDRGSNGNPIEEHARFQSFSDIEAVFKKYSALLGRESEGFGGAMEGSSLASLPRALGAADENADRRASVTVVTTSEGPTTGPQDTPASTESQSKLDSVDENPPANTAMEGIIVATESAGDQEEPSDRPLGADLGSGVFMETQPPEVLTGLGDASSIRITKDLKRENEDHQSPVWRPENEVARLEGKAGRQMEETEFGDVEEWVESDRQEMIIESYKAVIQYRTTNRRKRERSGQKPKTQKLFSFAKFNELQDEFEKEASLLATGNASVSHFHPVQPKPPTASIYAEAVQQDAFDMERVTTPISNLSALLEVQRQAPFQLEGRPMSINRIPIAAGSMNIGMSWTPAQPRLSFAGRSRSGHFGSLPGTPKVGQGHPRRTTIKPPDALATPASPAHEPGASTTRLQTTIPTATQTAPDIPASREISTHVLTQQLEDAWVQPEVLYTSSLVFGAEPPLELAEVRVPSAPVVGGGAEEGVGGSQMGGDLDGPLMVEEVPSEMPTVEAVEDEPVKDEPSGDEQNRDVGTTGADASQMQTQVKRESVNPTIEFPSEPAYPLALQPELPHSQNTSPESAASHHLHPQPQAAAPSPFDTSSEEPLSGWGGSEAEYGLERPRELERSVGRREQGNIASNRKGSEKQVVADSARETSVSVMSDASEARVAMKTTAAGITGPPETDASSAQIPDVNVPGSREHQMAEDQMVEQDLGLTAEADVQALATDGTPEHQVAEAMTDIPVNAELGADLGAMGRGIEGSMLLEEEQPDAGAEEMEESDDDEDWFGVSSKFKTREPSAPPAGPSQIAQVRSIQMTAEQGTALYHRIHGNERRRATMSDDDRRKYPVFFEQHNESEQLAQMHKESREKEIAALTAQLADTEVPVPAYLRRRGILLGFRGDFALALADLDKAFEYDPFNSEACWYRHQLLLLNGDVQKALRDLDMITETNRLHMAAFQTRGRIYQELGMIKMAIVNYSQVIKLKPHDADAYFQRATLFEQEDEMVYANEDYRMVRNLDPNNEPALRNLAMYSFQRQLWGDSLAAFTRLIQLNVKNSEAYLFRGRAYAHRGDWEEALQDITTAIHISPQDAQAYFHRASLFRRRNPFKAIEDFSLSILLDTTDTFYEAYYQRGLLYYSLEQYEYAVADLITVTELEPLHHQAYLSLGILYMRFLNNLPAALRCLQKCVSINPIQTYGYLCCGDLYQMMLKTPPAETPPAVVLRPSSNPSSRAVSRGGKPSDLDILLRTNEHYMKAAVRQYDKAIHLSPSSANLYLYRGRVLLRLGLMREATNDFQIAFALNAEIAQTFVQRALILSFQRKYQQIIDEFNRESRLKTVEDPQLYMLVAKARISCGDHEGALKNLAEALRHNKRESEVYLLRGICYEKLRDWANAIKEFTPCIQLNPQFSKAYYHRGISKLHLRDEDGTYDLDKAIKLDPDFFEAYIARASYYQSKGEYNLAIDDCDEASRIEPTSIRACLLKGACNCKLGEFDMAIQDFTKAMVIDRTSHYALYNRAVTYQLMKEYESAIKDYSTAMLLCSDSNAYRNRGLLYWQQGDPENALIDLYAARDAFPEDAKLRALLGLCLQKLGKVEQAIEEFSSAIKLNVFMREAYIARANVHAMAGQTEQARKDYLRVLHMDPRCIEALINIAYTFQRDGRQKKAYDLFTAALAIDPNCKPALEGRAVIQYGRANFFGALIDVSKAIALDPRNAEYLTNAGVICQALGDDVSAMQSYKLALKSDPEYAHAHLNMANMCFSQSKYEEALRQYTEVLKTVPNCVAAYLNRGITKAILKDLTGALDDFNRAAIPENTTAEVFFNRAHVLQLLGRQEEAEKDYTHILQLSPADSLVYLRRGDVRGHRADMYGAMEDYAMAISQSAD